MRKNLKKYECYFGTDFLIFFTQCVCIFLLYFPSLHRKIRACVNGTPDVIVQWIYAVIYKRPLGYISDDTVMYQRIKGMFTEISYLMNV